MTATKRTGGRRAPAPGALCAAVDAIPRIEAAMRNLPLNDTWKISKEEGFEDFADAFIPWMAEEYVDFIDPEPWSPPRSRTAEQVSNIAAAAHKLFSAMHSLQGPGIELLKHRRPTLGTIKKASGLLADDADRIAAGLRRAPREKRKGSNRPARVADKAAQDFARICGRPPRLVTEKDGGKSISRGDFLDFLGAVYAALNVDADPLKNAREAISRLKGVDTL